MNAACIGKWELFDSADMADHMEAASLCADCPLLLDCQLSIVPTATRSEYSAGVSGTWAGVLYREGRRADTRWSGTCPTCGSKSGRSCVSPSGNSIGQPHISRSPNFLGCACCGNTFTPNQAHWRYCSDECATTMRRKSKRASQARRASRSTGRKVA